MDPLRLINADALTALKALPSDSIQCVVTSPPYWGLRDYGVAGQIGLEETLDEFLTKLVTVFAEVRRVLKPDGVCWVNMGDCYAGGGRGGSPGNSPHVKQKTNAGSLTVRDVRRMPSHAKPKDLVGQPWRLAFALQAAGWWLRRDVIWHKPNPMPETVYDRPSTAHEYVFLFTKSERYFYNSEEAREPVTGGAHVRRKIVPAGWAMGEGPHTAIAHQQASSHRKVAKPGSKIRNNESFADAVNDLVEDRNWRSVWTIASEPYPGSHFATFPETLARRCIIAGTRAGDTVLDPFGGSGTTGAVAIDCGRNAVLIELNPEYCALIRQRCTTTIGLPLSA